MYDTIKSTKKEKRQIVQREKHKWQLGRGRRSRRYRGGKRGREEAGWKQGPEGKEQVGKREGCEREVERRSNFLTRRLVAA